jgi:DNA invertase Pin-like site-specific DNA recombinase
MPSLSQNRHAPDVNRHAVRQQIGYTRVSTVTQTLDQQNQALAGAGASKTFSDTMSGARDDRPGLAELMAYIREGDTVVVWKLDRLGRNMLHILQTVQELTNRGVTLVSVTDGIDSSTPAGRMMIGVLGSLAEYERELTKERTALKRVVSRANGTKFGRPRKVDNAEHILTAERMKADGHTARAIAKYLGVSRATLYRYFATARPARDVVKTCGCGWIKLPLLGPVVANVFAHRPLVPLATGRDLGAPA